MSTRDQLIDIRNKHNLTRSELASMLGVAICTLDRYLEPETSKTRLDCPKWRMELLNFKLGSEK